MAEGTLQFDGADDGAITSAFSFPDRFTVFWDVGWPGEENKGGRASFKKVTYMRLTTRPMSRYRAGLSREGHGHTYLTRAEVSLRLETITVNRGRSLTSRAR